MQDRNPLRRGFQLWLLDIASGSQVQEVAMINKRNVLATTEAPAAEPVADATPAQAEQPASEAAPAWTDTDEAAYVQMLARRKAAKAKRPTGAPRTRLGDDTVLVVGGTVTTDKSVYATIKATVAEAGEDGITRAALIAKLKSATFVSAAAKPQDEAWLKGWVSGALRNAVVAVAAKPAA
jgi:hypothetical protein